MILSKSEYKIFTSPFSVALELSTTLKVDAFHTQTGLNHIARLHSDSILDGALIIENGNSMRVRLNVPEEKQTIVDVR